ncbi:MAG: hypothetical protein JKY86_15440 [Gammaproteobacteria bacterium]|nr:hypothetical protein [Gammaproteobacteria bacterium]
MASRFILPFADVGDGITPSDGALLEFFITGTETLKDTFSDEALTTPNANPVVADGNGVFADIWMPDGARYKVTLDDKNAVQKFEADPIISPDEIAPASLTSKTFDTVALMVASSELNIGDIVETSGYTTKGDRGDGRYEVVAAGTGTPDQGSFINLLTHQAKALFYKGRINCIQFGAIVSSSTSVASINSTALQNHITYCVNNNVSAYIPDGDYPYDTTLSIPHQKILELVGESRQSTRLRYTPLTGDGVKFEGETDGSSVRHITIRNFAEAIGAGSTGTGLNMDLSQTDVGGVRRLRDIVIEDLACYGFQINIAIWNTINVVIRDIYRLTGESTSDGANDVGYNIFNGNTGSGGSNNIVIDNAYCSSASINISVDCNGVLIMRPVMESPTKYCFENRSTSPVTVISAYPDASAVTASGLPLSIINNAGGYLRWITDVIGTVGNFNDGWLASTMALSQKQRTRILPQYTDEIIGILSTPVDNNIDNGSDPTSISDWDVINFNDSVLDGDLSFNTSTFSYTATTPGYISGEIKIICDFRNDALDFRVGIFRGDLSSPLITDLIDDARRPVSDSTGNAHFVTNILPFLVYAEEGDRFYVAGYQNSIAAQQVISSNAGGEPLGSTWIIKQ